MEKKHKLLILYASQTGNAMDAAERIAREAERRGCPVSLLSLDRFDPSRMPKERAVIFVASTTGQGDAPDTMKAFWRFLLQKSLFRKWLEGVNYAVFGLGDSGYQKYNFVAKKLDKRLLDLGGRPLLDRGLGDDQHPSGYEGALDPWMASLWNVLYEMDPIFFPSGVDFVISNTELMDHPKVHITYHDKVQSPISDAADLESMASQIYSSRSMSPGNFAPDKSRPQCWLKMIRNSPLTKAGSGKDVRHLEFKYISNVVNYEVGDALEVLPSQSPAEVDAFIKRCNLDPEAFITVQFGEPEDDHDDYTSKSPVRLRKFVELAMDIASASPRRYFFEVMSHFAAAEHEKERLQYFASAEGRDDLYQYNQKERRTVLEVLEDFPSVQMPFEWLVQLVPPLRTRAFSISSSPSAHPNQVHLTVNVVSWLTPFKRKRVGLCSTWLASLDPQQGVVIPVWFQKGSLPPPPPSLPLILVGPGTGCAPFRGFVAERSVQSKHIPTAPVLFFFGCCNKENDFLYHDFWRSHSENNGVLSETKGGGFYAAFSRDQPEKVYVQHKMRENGLRVWKLLGEGADVYVAGSSTKMPEDVMAALEEIICKEGGVEKEAAVRWIRALERAGKYHVEAWS